MKNTNRLVAAALCIVMLFTLVACTTPPPSGDSGSNQNGNQNGNGGNQDTDELSSLIVNSKNVPMQLWYDEQAPFDNECSPEASMMAGQDIGWQNWSLPIGNGYFGANVFGRTESERVQITEKTLSNPWQIVKTQNGVTSWPQVAGLNNFSETYIDFNHPTKSVKNYKRALDVNTAIASTVYDYNGATYSREYFVSYPDKALVIRLDAENGPLSFTLRPTIPFEQSYMDHAGDRISKTGTVTSSVEGGVGCIELSGTLGFYGVDFVGYYRVYTTGGTVTADTVQHSYKDTDGTSITDTDGVIKVENASSAIIVATFGTDYELCTENFQNGQYSANKQTAKTTLDDAREKVSEQLCKVTDEIYTMPVDEAYNYLKQRHLEDYQNLYNRVDLDLNCSASDLNLTTDQLIKKYNSGSHSTYLDALLFQYGRYLIIASSREGGLPANLQGVWNCYNVPAWSSGYWSNINIQMNYWHVFSTNLEETFIPYLDYNTAYMPVAEKFASDLINTHNPSVSGQDGGNGWTMGVSGNPFFFNGDRSCGNLGLLTQLFYDYYEFTKDEEVLKKVYEILANAARFVTKCVKEYDGKYLVEYCDSPEMYVDGVWYYTTGTTYAQTLAYINNYGALYCAKELGIDLDDSELLSTEEYSILSTIMEQIDKYDPIIVGLSGQIKEFREEDYYGSLGNPNHRHISQLVGLFPGNIINSGTDAWMDAALVSINGRNEGLNDWPNGTTASNEASIVAWAWAHKQAMYARAGEGDLALDMLKGNLRNSTLQNLLMVCGKIFQIEASSGTTAAIAEMLLQSDEEFIEILPAIPTEWSAGSYTGLVARGNFEVSVAWEDSTATKINLTSKKGGEVSVKYPGFGKVAVYNSKGEAVDFTVDGHVITFDTVAGETYYITGFQKIVKVDQPQSLNFQRMTYDDFILTWDAVSGAEKYNVYVAYENDPTYTYVGTTDNTSFPIEVAAGKENVRKTFAVTAVKGNTESKRTLCYSNPISTELELYSLSWNTSGGKLTATAFANENAGQVCLYEKDANSSSYTLAGKADGMTVTVDYTEGKSYALAVISKLTGEESQKLPLTQGNHASNIINNKPFNPTKDALNSVYNENYGYSHLTDAAEITSGASRFASKTTNGIFEATVDLDGVYSLNDLKIYLYGGIDYAGNNIKIERLYDGKWHTVISCSSNSEIGKYLVDENGIPCLSFDMQQGKAYKIKITISSSITGKGISFYEITLSGDKTAETVEYTNVFKDKEFVASSSAAGNIYSGAYGYQTLTDGIIGQENSGRYSSKMNGGKVEATLDLGALHILSDFKVYLYKDGISKFGTGLTVEVLYNGEWKTVVSAASVEELEKNLVKNSGGDLLIFDLDDIYASKIRFLIPGQGDSGWTTFYEIECSGIKANDTDTGTDPDVDPSQTPFVNILKGKEFVPTADAKAQVLVASWFAGGGYEALTDGNKIEEQVGRFSTLLNNTTAFMDATLDLGTATNLDTLRFYLYDTKSDITEAAKKASVGKDMLIQVYANGAWTDVITCADNAALCEYLVINDGFNNDYLEFDLGGVKAEKIRFYISGSVATTGITFQEIECSGY